MKKDDFTPYIGKFVQLTYKPSISTDNNSIMGKVQSLFATFLVFDVNEDGKDIPVYYKNIKNIKEMIR